MAVAGELTVRSMGRDRGGVAPALVTGILVGLAYTTAAQLGFRVAIVAEQITTVWAPTGIAIATLLLCGTRLWPAIWLGAFAANAGTSAPLWTAAILATGNTLEAVAAVWTLRRVPRFAPTLERVGDVIAFLIVAVAASPIVSASIGVGTLCAAGAQSWDRFGPLWWNWWFGDALGAVIVAPAILTVAQHRWPWPRIRRAAVFAGGAVAITSLAFGLVPLRPHPVEYIVFPLVIAAAVTGGPAITSLVVLSASSAAIWQTARGSLILLQMFMGVLAATALLLAAAIAERRRVEERAREAADVLRHREEMLRLAQRAGGVATFEWDFRSQTAHCSPEFFGIFGLPARPGVMTGAQWAEFVHPDDREPMTTHLNRAIDGREPAVADYRITTADGRTRWLTYAGQIQRTRDGDRMLGIVVDITNRKALESELRQANQLKDEFLATLSHELRTPLNAVLGWAHMLREGSLEPEMRQRALEAVERNARLQAQLVEDLLDVSRIVAGKLQIRTGAVDLCEVVTNAVETVRAGVSAKGLTLDVQLPPAPLAITGDADRLQQVVWNLVSNAVKFTGGGGMIAVELRQRDATAEIVVRDNGKGIDPAFRPHAFEPFRQMDASKSRTHGGLGLGLSIVRHLVDAHGGTVTVESDGIGRGSTFRVTLPLRGRTGDPLTRRPRAGAGSEGSPGDRPAGA
jgi:PAS domain S-box-containing protein